MRTINTCELIEHHLMQQRRIKSLKGEPNMPKFDITKLNVAIDRLLEVTTNPRHRFLLQAYSRHRYLEVAGRYEEIFAPDMMSMDQVYHMHADKTDAVLRGQDQVKRLYRMWAE